MSSYKLIRLNSKTKVSDFDCGNQGVRMKREYTPKELQINAEKAAAEMERKAKLHGKNVELGPAKID